MPSYPTRLLPEIHSEILEEIDLQTILCRWTTNELKDEDNKLNPAAVFGGNALHLKTYSLNMVPPSEVADILIKILDTSGVGYEKTWVVGTLGLCPKENEFEVANNRKYFLFKAEKLHNYKSTFPYPVDEQNRDKWCSFELLITHEPLNANYSHCQFKFRYLNPDGSLLERVSENSFKKVVAADVRQHLIEHSKFSIEDF